MIDITTVENLNIPITYFENLEQMMKELGLTGMLEADRKFFKEYFKGVGWNETKDGHIVMFPLVVKFLRENTPIFNS